VHQYRVDSGDISLSAATAKTALQLVAGSTRKSKILEFGVSYASTTSTDGPVLCEFLIQTSAGTSSSFTPVLMDTGDPVAIQTALNTITVEPSGTTAVGAGPWRVTPVGGLFVYQFPVDQELKVAISTRIGFRLTAPSALSSVRAYIVYQE